MILYIFKHRHEMLYGVIGFHLFERAPRRISMRSAALFLTSALYGAKYKLEQKQEISGSRLDMWSSATEKIIAHVTRTRDIVN